MDAIQLIEWKDLSREDQNSFFENLNESDNEQSTRETVLGIMESVRSEGIDALVQVTQNFDQKDFRAQDLEVNLSRCKFDSLIQAQIQAMEEAASNIKKFHEAQIDGEFTLETIPGVKCERIYRPIENVGLYIPGGSAPLVSTVLMMAIPAKLAGCKNIVLCSPPSYGEKPWIHPAILYAAKLTGIDQVFALGGAQAIAAMTYGVGSIPSVDKIFGPGNRWVTQAKVLASQIPGGPAIDMPAGPSEVLVLADESSNPEFIASDLLSQAEHDPDSKTYLLCNSLKMLQEVQNRVKKQVEDLPRKEIAMQALKNSYFVLAKIEECIQISNRIAPEHLIIQTSNPRSLLDKISCAGSVFLGDYSPESVGDYASGTNHVLPTSRNARAYSGLNLDSFRKSITVQELTLDGLRRLGPTVETLASLEELEAHKRAVSIRLEQSCSKEK